MKNIIIIKKINNQIYLLIEQYNEILNKYETIKKYNQKILINKLLEKILLLNLNDFYLSEQYDIFSFKINNRIPVLIFEYSNIKNNDIFSKLNYNLNKKKIDYNNNKKTMKKFLAIIMAFGFNFNINCINLEDGSNELKNYSIYKEENINNETLNFLNISKIKDYLIDYKNNIGNNKLLKNINISLQKNEKKDSNITTNFNKENNKKIKEEKKDSNYKKSKQSKEKNQENEMIEEFSKIYYLDYEFVQKLYNENIEQIEKSDNPKKTFIILVKNAFYNSDIDKTPTVSSLSESEKEDYIIYMAKDIYDVQDKELLALILAIHRLETGNGTSRRCIYDNNLGGISDSKGMLTFKTFEIGAECFVRNVTNIVSEAYESSNYNYDLPIEYNIQDIYCGDGWGKEVNKIKNKILNNNELDKYFNSKENNIKKLKYQESIKKFV